MIANVTFSQVWYNSALSSFFLREQAERTISLMFELIEESTLDAIAIIDEYADDMDIDELEEMFYSYSAEDCAREIGLTITEEEED